MNNINIIENDELLYRRVRKDRPGIHPNDRKYEYKSGILKVNPIAFRDEDNETSVDRARMNGNNPFMTQRHQDDGVIMLSVKDVKDIIVYNEKSNIKHGSDIVHDPQTDNFPHYLIVMKPVVEKSPECARSQLRHGFRQRLADAANSSGWALRPVMYA